MFTPFEQPNLNENLPKSNPGYGSHDKNEEPVSPEQEKTFAEITDEQLEDLFNDDEKK